MPSIVVADVNYKSAELIMSSLDDRNYVVMTTDSEINALSKIKLFKPDVVILNSELSDISGFDLCRKIKQNPETADCLILFLDTYQTELSRIKALEAGADDIMTESIDSYMLNAKVKSLLRVKTLSNQLKEKYKELEEKNRMIDMQLEMGRQVQSSLIRELDIKNKHVNILTRYKPAFIIGGDFYDIIELGEDRFLVIIGDVSGHGISSALLTSMLKIMIRNLNPLYEKPGQLLTQLNNQFMEVFSNSGSGLFICIFAMMIDAKNRKLVYSNAGLAYPIHVSYNKKNYSELSLPGVPIGIIQGSAYESKTMGYSKNDLLLFYTDGLSDIFYKDDPDKFLTNVTSLLINSLDAGLKEVSNMLLDEFYDYSAQGSEKLELDDVSLILCRL